MRLRKETSKTPVEQVGREPPPEFANLTVELLQPVQHSKRYAITNVDSLGVIERFTFAEITRETARWAQLLRENGLQPGDRVLIVAGREWGWRCALLGAIHAGAVAVPCPPSLPLREIRTVAEHADASLLVSLRPPPELVELDGRSALTADDLETVDPAHALEQRPHRTDPRDIALILYAWHGLDLSGTMHTHSSLLAQADTAEHWLGVDEDERIWATADDGSGPSIWLLLAAWRRAASIVVVDLELDSDAKLELLDRLRPAALWFSDDEYAILGSAAVPPWVDLRSIRRALVDSDETEGASSFATAFGAALVPVFALDELGVVAGWPAGREGHADAQTAQPAPGVQVAVVGEDGTELPPGEVGDVAVRGDAPTLFTGYAGKEGRSRSAGWFRFGWRGALTAEGALRLESRSPREVEPVEATADLPVPEVLGEPQPAEPVAAEPEPAAEEDAARAERKAAEVEAQQAARAEAREAEEREREVAAARAAADALLLAEQEAKERAAAEAEEQRRAEQEAKEREKSQAEERRRAEEHAKAQQEIAAADARQRGEEEKRREKERQREEKEARARAEREAKEREKAEAEERRRAEEDAKTQAKLAAADAKRQAEEEKRREEEREREEKETRARAEQEAKEREKAEAEERRRAEEDAKIQAKAAAADARQRAKDDRESEKREAEAAKVQAKVDAADAKQRAKDDKEREKREAKERAEREKSEAEAAKVQAKVDAAEAKQRAKDDKEREKREAVERVEREKAEAEAAKVQAKVDAAEAKQRAEEEKRREKEREREEKEGRSRAEQEAKEAERAERRAAREDKRRAPKAPKPADDGQRRFGRRRREVVEEPEPEHVPDVVARIQQYGMSAASTERPAEPPEQPEDE